MIRRLRFLSLLPLAALLAPAPAAAQDPEIYAVRYGTIRGFALRGLLPDAARGESLDIAMSVWLVRAGDRVVLVDTGFFRDGWFERFEVSDYVRPDEAVARFGVNPDAVTDIVVTHAHWDHMGGLELFPNATAWIQRDEFVYYTADGWQPDAAHGGIDPADIRHLVDRNLNGRVRLVDGDGVTILPGLTVFTGARHTFASQYVLVDGAEPVVLASDNAYLYRGLAEGRASATFTPGDREGNVAAARRMIALAGAMERVVPGHDPELFTRYPAVGEGVVRIR